MRIRRGRAVRAGFTLVEVMVALLLLVVALVALEGGAAVTVRMLADAERETLVTRLGDAERERAYGGPCAAAQGVDSTNGVRVGWSAMPVGGSAMLVTRAAGAFRTRYGMHATAFDGAGPCR